MTAEQFMNDIPSNMRCSEAMILFAKMHVELALSQAAEKARTKFVEDKYRTEEGISMWDIEIDRESILNSYNLNNIK